MRCLLLNLAAVAVVLLSFSVRAEVAASEASSKVCQLIPADGKVGSLDGWKSFHLDGAKTADVWSLDDPGVLHCKGSPLGYLYTEKDYDNFVLDLDWRWPPGKEPGKGGVLIRTIGPNKIWPKSLEAQINAGDAGDFWGLDGYALDGPADRKKTLDHPQFGKLTNVKKSAAVEKPAGQWNHYRIVAEGPVVTLEINGQIVNRATACETAPGKILLTAEGSAIEFRNVQIRPSDKP
ncbi:MAG TPA: DUF1080 domain-containing protein [Candidatus Anammoximicrobium sp.]|mgnify:CR=1 FL=1|nr:DUF1080 domain-containing protein [Candidatus Anammoximicrobium sp.]